MNKKGIGTAAVISIILGLIVVASMGGVLWKNKAFIAEKIFGKEILPTPPGEGEFVPYEIEYTEEELQIMDSMNALTCAINSIAVGKFDPSDTRLCPEQKKEEKETQPPEEKKEETPEVSLSSVTGAITGFFAKITGMASSNPKVAKYGDVEVSCNGKRIETIYLGSKTGKKINSWKEDYTDLIDPSLGYVPAQNIAAKQVGDSILDCWIQYKDVEDKESYYKCDILNAYPLLGIQEKDNKKTFNPIVITEGGIIIYLNQIIRSNDPRKDAAKELLSTWQGALYKGTNRIRIKDTPILRDEYNLCGEDKGDTETDNICGKTSHSFGRNKYCMYFDTGETIVTRDVITIADCREFVAKDTFTCNVKNFQLPQEITEEGSWNPLTWVAGYNDPKYIAYYEAFPDGMDKFWHVDGISMTTVGLIVGTAAVDLVPLVGKGVGKAVSSVLRRGGKEVGEEVVK
ncbi:hypothetical protein GF343_05910, partial [Candidatus Woesearchaeota archaeon]|nr:hypothetical protein [Candidatus Woesearchaeota archaeon]